MFGISGEHLLVLLVILLIFGPKRLPDLGHSLGRTMKNFKDAMSGRHDEGDRPVDTAAAQPRPTPITANPASQPQAEAAKEEKQKDPTSV